MIYANNTDLDAFIEADIPEDSVRLLERASQLVDYITLNRIDTTNTVHLSAAKNAVCSQVEYWMQVGEEVGMIGSPQSFTIGSYQQQGALPMLAPRAKQFLLLAGLLSRSVKMRGTSSQLYLIQTLQTEG